MSGPVSQSKKAISKFRSVYFGEYLATGMPEDDISSQCRGAAIRSWRRSRVKLSPASIAYCHISDSTTNAQSGSANDFFINLLTMNLEWKPIGDSNDLFEGRDRRTGERR